MLNSGRRNRAAGFVESNVFSFVEAVALKFRNSLVSAQPNCDLVKDWIQHRNDFLKRLKQECLLHLKKLSQKNFRAVSLSEITLVYACFGAIAYLDTDQFASMCRECITQHPLVISIFSFLLSPENWCYIRGAIPSRLTFDDYTLFMKSQLLASFLNEVKPGTVLNIWLLCYQFLT